MTVVPIGASGAGHGPPGARGPYAARMAGTEPLPEPWRRALDGMRSQSPHPQIVLREAPAPARLAPFSAALTADVLADGEELATGRLVLLHDPAGHDAWAGEFRLVSYARAEIEPEIAADPLLGQVGWSWLVESLAAHGAQQAQQAEVSGTVTRVSSEGFGSMAGQGGAQLEIRSSWTPAGDIAPHVEAWCDLLCIAAGLPPLPPGVATLHRR